MLPEDPIDVLIYSSPKGGGNTYQYLLKNRGYNVFYTHNKFFFKNPGPVCQNMGIELEDYIKLQINLRKDNPKLKKLKILYFMEKIIIPFGEECYNCQSLDAKFSKNNLRKCAFPFDYVGHTYVESIHNNIFDF